MIIIAREITVSALREWMAELGKRSKVAVSWIGKWKTTLQLASIALLIWRYNDIVIYIALAMLAIATVLTIWSMIMYLKAGFATMLVKDAPETKEPKAIKEPVKEEKAKESV